MSLTEKIPDFRILIIETYSFSEKDQTVVGVTCIKSYYSKTKPWICIFRGKFNSFLIILACHNDFTYLFVTFGEICHRFKTFRFILEVFMIYRDSVGIPFKVTENISFIKNGEGILRVNSQCIVISFHCFTVRFKLIINYSKIVPGAVRKRLFFKVFQIIFNTVLIIFNLFISVCNII